MPEADDGQTQQSPEGGEGHNLKVLREKAERADKADAELASARRELAIVRAGIDTDHPAGKFFAEHFSGDPTDTEALVEAAKAIGVPLRGAPAAPAPAAPEGQTQGSEGQQQQTREDLGTSAREGLQQGAPSDEGFKENPYTTAIEAADAVKKRGGTRDEEFAAFLGTITAAANAGDTRVIATNGRAPVNPLVG